MKFQCACCEWFTLHDQEIKQKQICKVCFWEDNQEQLVNPDLVGKANRLSLNQSKRNYQELGVSDLKYQKYARLPNEDEKTLHASWIREINILLEDLAEENREGNSDICNDYIFEQVPSFSHENVSECLRTHLRLSTEEKLDLKRLQRWEELFLSKYPDSEKIWLASKADNMTYTDLTAKQFIIEVLQDFFQNEYLSVYLLEVNPLKYYACCSEEYLFVTNSEAYLLSFQLQD